MRISKGLLNRDICNEMKKEISDEYDMKCEAVSAATMNPDEAVIFFTLKSDKSNKYFEAKKDDQVCIVDPHAGSISLSRASEQFECLKKYFN